MNAYCAIDDQTFPDIRINGGIWYLSDVNCFTDDEGHVIFDMEELFQPWEIRYWITRCEENSNSFMPVKDIYGREIDMFYLVRSDDTDDDTYELLTGHSYCFPDDPPIIYASHHID